MSHVRAEAHNACSWCIVIADDHGPPQSGSTSDGARKWPVQYCSFGDPITLLQKALHRATSIAPANQILLTVRDEDRERWEPALWFVRPERRFISDSLAASSLTISAALLSIAAESIAHEVTILPARCLVENEWALSTALGRLHNVLPRVPEGVGTLGMIESEVGIDEDYLVPCTGNWGVGVRVQGTARQPAEWVARHLHQHGAMVSSGIMVGYAGRFVAHVWKHRPALTKALADLAWPPTGEVRLTADRYRGMARSEWRPLRWSAPIFPQRAFPVYHCGWRGLRTARAVANIGTPYPRAMTRDRRLEFEVQFGQ